MTAVGSTLRVDDYAVEITSESGQTFQFSSTADDPDDLVQVVGFGGARGTGFTTAVLQLQRNPYNRYDDLALLEHVVIEGPDGTILFEGDIAGLPFETGQGIQFTVLGDYSIFNDREDIHAIIIDQDASNWETIPLDQKAAERVANYNAVDGQQIGNSLELTLAALPWTNPGLALATLAYQAPLAEIGEVYGTWSKTAGVSAGPDAYKWEVILSTDDGSLFTETSGDLQAAGPASFSVVATQERHYAFLRFAYTSTVAGTDNLERTVTFNPIVKGTHNLETITPSTVLKWLIDTYFPKLTYSEDSITDHPYEIPQLLFEGVSGSTAAAMLNAYANWNIEVWERREVCMNPDPDLSPGSEDFILNQELGDELDPDDQVVNENYPVNYCDVFYTDSLTGIESKVSGEDDYRLRDDSEINPCNAENRDRRLKVEISFPCQEDDAIWIGSVAFAEAAVLTRGGSGKAVAVVQTPGGQWVPAQNIRSGHVVRYAHEDFCRQVYEYDYEVAAMAMNLKFTDQTQTLSAILARMGITISLVKHK